MQTTVNQRVLELIKIKSKSNVEFERMCKIKKGGLNGVINMGTKPSFDVIQSILDAYPNLSPDWLIYVSGNTTNHPERCRSYYRVCLYFWLSKRL
jgi:hypothetical protein